MYMMFVAWPKRNILLGHADRTLRSGRQTGIRKAEIGRVFGQRTGTGENVSRGLYARVSTNDQQTMPLQMRAMREYAGERGWTSPCRSKRSVPALPQRELREKLLEAARRREIDVVLVWRLDRWGRSLVDLLVPSRNWPNSASVSSR